MKRNEIQKIAKTCNKCGKRIRVKPSTTACPRCSEGELQNGK